MENHKDGSKMPQGGMPEHQLTLAASCPEGMWEQNATSDLALVTFQ